MFFKPPQVKSMSRYAEFGVYLHNRHFMAMLFIAILMHASILGVYALIPREQVIKIPVRVLNIKLGNFSDSQPVVEEHRPVVPPVQTGVETREVAPKLVVEKKTEHPHEKVTQSLMDSELSRRPTVKTQAQAAYSSKKREEKVKNLAGESTTLSTPKQYVRESELAATQSAAGYNRSKEEGEVLERYEQAISLWIAEHKVYPEAAKLQGIEGNAVVRIRISRNGRILYAAIDRSSGNSLIDTSVISMVRASDPVPPVPDNYPEGSQLEFLIPVSFRLQ